MMHLAVVCQFAMLQSGVLRSMDSYLALDRCCRVRRIPCRCASVLYMATGGNRMRKPRGLHTDSLRIVLVGRDLMLRNAVSVLLQQAGIAVVGEADQVDAALALIAEAHPDVVLSGAAPPALDPADLAARVREQLGPDTPVVVLTTHDDEAPMMAALRSNVAGYLSADLTTDAFVAALRAAKHGIAVFGPRARAAVSEVACRSGRLRSDACWEDMTERERETLRLLIAGMMNKDIAAELGVGVRTAELYVGRVLKKLGARTRTEAVAMATQRTAHREGSAPPREDWYPTGVKVP